MTILIRPLKSRESKAVYQMFQEIPPKENGASNKAHGLTFAEFQNFCKTAVLRSKGKNVPAGHVAQILYLIFDEETPVGFGKFRPFMNEECIKNRAFHFGYMIAPKYRRKGYATHFISFIKKEAEKYNLTEIRGTAFVENIASCRVMEKNGGVLELCADGEATYVIPLKNN